MSLYRFYESQFIDQFAGMWYYTQARFHSIQVLPGCSLMEVFPKVFEDGWSIPGLR